MRRRIAALRQSGAVLPAVCQRPIPLGTKTIAAGSQILICVGAANRDPSVFTNPDGLDLTRKPAHLSYGTGAYRCIGARLAHMQAGTALSKFIARTTAYAPIKGGTNWRTAPYVQRGPSSVKLQVTWNTAL
ncbi:cytochrome P450 [Hymenobacter cellulosilyticus]|uniref:Cytochrome P450 n=1 Tax=Hymenobacter cellulosilyticus TaxID=2932248 RepID=A0A8T9Q718_9BACT|nr:cytochrome P450 [Hymenobacter cellulosilyticus]UOQ72925.1 cytochrome P450 [Hymenobacter cellulosilyticus]